MARSRKSKSDDSSLFQGPGGGGGGADAPLPGISAVKLHEAARARYLNYALSVITSRALPDVRDGMKPVHRRILFTMWQNGLDATAKHRKSATVVGDVMGRYHPHGDSAIYEALVRMAQPWIMRSTLIDGSGNFGSIDDDPPAAMRYTECRLTPIATELLSEIDQSTVPFRPNFDGTRQEPVILPARFPALLVNGSSGIAVGMATNIPPHNLGEVCRAALKLMDDPEVKPSQLIGKEVIQGPDFPTGGLILNSKSELIEIYKTGSGSIRMRGTVEHATAPRGGKKLYITSIPYGVTKSALVEQIAQVVLTRKLPLVLDVKDISTDDVRIELEMKKDADEQMVLAYLYKHTSLQSNFNVNLTFLVPTNAEDSTIARPNEPEERNIKTMLWHFLHFRLEVVTNRLQHELDALNKRIHILEGFELVFDALDEIIRIIRASDGKADAAAKIIKRFKLDDEQTDAILELKLYRLAKLEILVIQQELKDKRKRAREIRKLLDEEEAKGRWAIVREEIQEIIAKYGKLDANKRRTQFTDVEDEPEFSAEDFIIDEDNHVLVTRDGWIKRQKEIKDPSSTRLREGDSVLTVEAGSTRATIVFFSNFGVAYSCRIIDVPATTGYGEPIQKLFKLKDGEKIIAALSLDPKAIGDIGTPELQKAKDGETLIAPPAHGVAATSDGYALRFSLAAFAEPSTRSGRRYARPSGDARVVGVYAITGKEVLIAAARSGRALLCKAREVNFLAGAGKGVLLMKLAKDDALLGFIPAADDRDTLIVKTNRDAEHRINTAKYELTSRGGKGREIIKTGQFTQVVPEEPSVPALIAEVEEE